MKKILFTLLAMFALSATANAQSMKVYQNGQLRAIYYVSKDDKVEFSEDFPFPEDNNEGHTDPKYVDLGLPSGVKWANMNVGASAPEEFGDYFAWGETESKSIYDWSTYKWCNGSNNTMTKYCTESKYGTVDNKTTLDPEDDAAHVNWGGAWRMPTEDEQKELLEECTWIWSSLNGMIGYKVMGPNGNSIFLPAAGHHYHGDFNSAGQYGEYWSSSLSTNLCYFARTHSFNPTNSMNKNGSSSNDRFGGKSIRPVCK